MSPERGQNQPARPDDAARPRGARAAGRRSRMARYPVPKSADQARPLHIDQG